MIGYKLLRIVNGKLYPLFINKKEETVIDEWLKSECYPTKGFAIRQGWHCCFKPYAPHLKVNLKDGTKRAWVEIEVGNYVKYDRPESQGGSWILADTIKLKRILTEKEVEEINNTYKLNK